MKKKIVGDDELMYYVAMGKDGIFEGFLSANNISVLKGKVTIFSKSGYAHIGKIFCVSLGWKKRKNPGLGDVWKCKYCGCEVKKLPKFSLNECPLGKGRYGLHHFRLAGVVGGVKRE